MIRQLIVVLLMCSLLASSVLAEIWSDDFNGDALDEKWIITQWRPWVEQPPNWSLGNGILRGQWPNWNGQFLLLEEYPSLDYTIQVRCRIDRRVQMHQWNGAGFVFRSSGPGVEPDANISPFYAYGINSPHVRFALHTGEAIEMVQVAPGQYDIGEWYTLKLVVSGSDFLGYVNDNLLCMLHDTRFEGEFVGLMISSHTHASFDDFMISDQLANTKESRVLATTWAEVKSN